jgi:hypothetical protein
MKSLKYKEQFYKEYITAVKRDDFIWSFIEKSLQEAYQKGYKAGKNHIDTEMRKATNDWHKHEQTGLDKKAEKK